MIKGIVACSPEGIIAIDGQMPWNVPEDLQYFKRHTKNQVVIMGRKTWVSMGSKCLPNRENIVVSKTQGYSSIAGTNAIIKKDLLVAIDDATLLFPNKDIWIIGGAEIYRQTMPILDKLYLTIINKEQVCYHEGSRTYLPGYQTELKSLFTLSSETKTPYATYQVYKRRIISLSNKETTIYQT